MTDSEPTQDAKTRPSSMAPANYVANQVPMHLSYVAACRGFLPPDPTKDYVYCELGCGRALTLITLAASNPQARFIGIDSLAGALDQARAMADEAELTNIEFIESPIEDLGALELPALDYVALQGIYVRLTEPELAGLRTLLTTRIKEGGLFYLEFLTLPGNLAVAAAWQLWKELSDCFAADHNSPAAAALDLLQGARDAQTSFFKTAPAAANMVQRYVRLKEAKPQAFQQMGSRLLSGDWRPRFFSQVVREMASVDLAYAGSSDLALNDVALCLPAEQHALFEDLSDPVAGEVLKDTLRNNHQRRDVFIKGAAPRAAEARRFLETTFYFAQKAFHPRPEVAFALPGGTKYRLEGALYEGLVKALEQGPARLVDLCQLESLQSFTAEETTQGVHRLVAGEHSILIQSADVRAPLRVLSGGLSMPGALNRALVRQAADRLWRVTLGAPLAGGGAVALMPMEAVFLDLLLSQGPDNIATAAQARLKESTQPFIIDGKQVPAHDIDGKLVQQALGQFKHGKLNNLFRFGILESPRTDLTLEDADDGFEF